MIPLAQLKARPWHLLVPAIIALCASCSSVGRFFRGSAPAQPTPSVTQIAQPTPTATPAPMTEATPSRHRSVRHRTHQAVLETPTPGSTPTANQPATLNATPSPSATSSLTLEDDETNRVEAEALLNQASLKLATVNRAKLSRDDDAVYGEASGLIAAARQALGQRDYLAATGLARKAAVLSDQLASGGAAH